MFLRASKLISIILFIHLVGIAIAESNGDDDIEAPSESEKDTPKESIPEEYQDATAKSFEEALKKVEDEMVSEMAPVVSEMMEAEEKYGEKVLEQMESSEKTPEMEEESVTTAEEAGTESKPETPEEKAETTSAASMVNTETIIEKEEAPKETFAVWSSKGKICLLAKFHAVFSVLYSSQRGEEKAEITVPKTAVPKGKCGSNAKLPLLQISWEKYAFTIMFNKTDEDSWAVTSMELTYDTSEPLFDGAVNDLCCLLKYSFDSAS